VAPGLPRRSTNRTAEWNMALTRDRLRGRASGAWPGATPPAPAVAAAKAPGTPGPPAAAPTGSAEGPLEMVLGAPPAPSALAGVGGRGDGAPLRPPGAPLLVPYAMASSTHRSWEWEAWEASKEEAVVVL
jgi:hypothetical protein